MANIILDVPRGYPCQKQTKNPGIAAIHPVVSPQCTVGVLVHRYVVAIHTSCSAHAFHLFDEHNRCLVSHTLRVPVPSTKKEVNLQILKHHPVIIASRFAYNADTTCTRRHRTLCHGQPQRQWPLCYTYSPSLARERSGD